MDIAILGAGAWGTALAIALSERHRVSLWTREDDVIQAMRSERENRRFFPGYRLPDALKVVDSFDAAVESAGLVIVATPVAGLRPTLRRLRENRATSKPLFWVCKGFEAGTALLPHQVAAEELGGLDKSEHAGKDLVYGVLTGPSFAEEVARGLPTAVTLAANISGFARRLAPELHHPRFRIYPGDDLPGAETGGAVKNVIAISIGICDGLGYGLNARAALMTRGLAEISRLGVALGGKTQTFMGLAGMGDLILTCTGDLSRNRRVGLALAAGKTLAQILAELGHVAEGVNTAREAARLAEKLGIEMPIAKSIDSILHRGVTVRDAVESLLKRDMTEENS
ncbi:MAG: NAD(P)-dependent glycerol-3-phosphate dehydrogenase [Candidatus Accumulibacter sp.]|nr:NAD(P)-dependent glycerol-3-phosphate dehydrogenase [Accumulibacter sp.]